MSNYHNDKDGPPERENFSSVGEDEFKRHVGYSQCPKCKNISIKNLRYIILGDWLFEEADCGGANFHTFCQCVECEHIWYAIHASVWEFVYDFDSQDHVETREPVVKSKSVEYYPPLPEDGYISLESIDALHRLSSSSKFDLRRLARLCEEINSNFRNKNYIAM